MEEKLFNEEYEEPAEHEWSSCFKRVSKIIVIGIVTGIVTLVTLWLVGGVK